MSHVTLTQTDSAWTAQHGAIVDWTPWLNLFDQIITYARRCCLPAFGSEAAKAKALVLTEYLGRADEGLAELERAEDAFGKSTILEEQRANILFQVGRDSEMLEVWGPLMRETTDLLSDPFAFRRAAISAVRLRHWGTAVAIFEQALQRIDTNAARWTAFGLTVDSALTLSMSANQLQAADRLADAILLLPAAAEEDGDPRWEASQRAAYEVASQIRNVLFNPVIARPKFQPGYASSPSLSVERSEPGQSIRSALLRGDVAKLCSCLGLAHRILSAPEVLRLSESAEPIVRFLFAEAMLARSFGNGGGIDLIPSILNFARAVRQVRLDRADDGEPQWFGMLVAGLVCASDNMLTHLEVWRQAADQLPPDLRYLRDIIGEMMKGALVDRHLLHGVMAGPENSPASRCGAAAQLLRGPLNSDETFTAQCFVASGLATDASYVFQEVFNFHIALRFAAQWTHFSENPFQLPNPRLTVPALQTIIGAVRLGNASLRKLLIDVASVLGYSRGAFLERIR